MVSANGASPPPGTVGSGIIAFSPITLQGNLVGTDATGTIGLATAGLGVAVSRTGPGAASLVGGITPELGNVLSGNSRGLELGNVTATVQGNRIGVGPDGTTPLPNGSVGIDVIGGTVTMGGTQPGAANIIANNRAQASV